jgi:hypothetical protein
METTETAAIPGSVPPPPVLVLNFQAQSFLREAGKWASFLGILGFIICAIILLASFFVGGTMGKLASVTPGAGSAIYAGVGGLITVIYILVDIVYFFFALYLYQFGSRVKSGIKFSNEAEVTRALGKLKSFFKLWGVCTIIVICLYVIIIAISIAVGIGASSLLHR